MLEALEGRRPDVADVYSPPHITANAKRMHLHPGFALDLTVFDEFGEKLDFRRADPRQRARDFARTQQPWMLVGSPPCTWHSQMQRRNLHKMTAGAIRQRTV